MTMLKRLSAILLIGALACVSGSHALMAQTATAKPAVQAPPGAAAKGPRPDQFKFPPLDFRPPKAAEFREVLSNGLVVYIAEDHEIPWFEASLLSPVISSIPIWPSRVDTCPQDIVVESALQRSTIGDPDRVPG